VREQAWRSKPSYQGLRLPTRVAVRLAAARAALRAAQEPSGNVGRERDSLAAPRGVHWWGVGALCHGCPAAPLSACLFRFSMAQLQGW